MSEHFRKRKQVKPLPIWGCIAMLACMFGIWLASGAIAYKLGSLLYEWIAATLA